MNAQTIGAIVAVLSPTITLIITVLAVLNSRIEKTTAPLDTPSLKILMIKRSSDYLVHDFRSFINFNIYYIIRSISYLFIILGINIAIIFYIYNISYQTYDTNTLLVYSSTILFISILLFIYYIYFYFRRLFNKEYRHYIFFKEVDIVIQADFQYLFDKSVEALKGMNLKIIEMELGNNEGTVNAIKVNINPFTTIKSITLKVQKVQYSENVYSVQFFFNKSETDAEVITINSQTTNTFIDRLISKSAKAGEKK